MVFWHRNIVRWENWAISKTKEAPQKLLFPFAINLMTQKWRTKQISEMEWIRLLLFGFIVQAFFNLFDVLRYNRFYRYIVIYSFDAFTLLTFISWQNVMYIKMPTENEFWSLLSWFFVFLFETDLIWREQKSTHLT